jgi:hypothetical protein
MSSTSSRFVSYRHPGVKSVSSRSLCFPRTPLDTIYEDPREHPHLLARMKQEEQDKIVFSDPESGIVFTGPPAFLKSTHEVEPQLPSGIVFVGPGALPRLTPEAEARFHAERKAEADERKKKAVSALQ